MKHFIIHLCPTNKLWVFLSVSIPCAVLCHLMDRFGNNQTKCDSAFYSGATLYIHYHQKHLFSWTSLSRFVKIAINHNLIMKNSCCLSCVCFCYESVSRSRARDEHNLNLWRISRISVYLPKSVYVRLIASGFREL